MVYLLAEVSAAHTRPLQEPPLDHVDTNDSYALHGVAKVVLDQALVKHSPYLRGAFTGSPHLIVPSK
ncbi:hypothetical protein CJF40_11580 [Pseudomonas lundensis]|jgi:hypothetical protein|uniref:Uncharacterized protein n=1 Tax=Pseudomonas lundensis TaxID=86185 RepID=A0ABX4GML1_9PSED|nr:hypothetical protein AA042_11070 [Pseudomonas lundensis]OZY28132.1 hypothetical protein CJF40_11580 [Pseudomonas lundensis]OZY36736.1 hypothetical protein CJF35_12520 [Pseudomonas lundensis]OZY45118.1 hypothetical protein CJF41_17040 [Pseudomonas lundensis]OZY55247.1 hypothetical protein CJF38_10855 [Pseudomonas lundensis]